MSWLDRQSFLGEESEQVLRDAIIGVAGLGGGGSHIVQQLAHLGIGNFVILDDDTIDDTNLNRLVGGQFVDIEAQTSKVEIARRLILGINPKANVYGVKAKWQEEVERIKTCDIVVGGLDSVRAKHELEGFCRRFLIPYIDMGMDVHELEGEFLIAGQVVLSMPGKPCLQCLGVVRQDALDEEGRRYGAAGGKPQVVWPNGVLASSAVGLIVQLVTPWHSKIIDSIYLEYDGNRHTMIHRLGYERALGRPCPHYPANETGDPGFDIRKFDPHVVEIKVALLTADARTTRMGFFQRLLSICQRR
jgi:molybdopterin-synthase adenylyltransferase